MRWSLALPLACVALTLACGCAYPRRSTPLSAVHSDLRSVQPPDGILRLRFLSAVVPP